MRVGRSSKTKKARTEVRARRQHYVKTLAYCSGLLEELAAPVGLARITPD